MKTYNVATRIVINVSVPVQANSPEEAEFRWDSTDLGAILEKISRDPDDFNVDTEIVSVDEAEEDE